MSFSIKVEVHLSKSSSDEDTIEEVSGGNVQIWTLETLWYSPIEYTPVWVPGNGNYCISKPQDTKGELSALRYCFEILVPANGKIFSKYNIER